MYEERPSSISESARPLLAKIEAAGEQKLARLEAVLELVDEGDVRRGREVFFGTKAAGKSPWRYPSRRGCFIE